MKIHESIDRKRLNLTDFSFSWQELKNDIDDDNFERAKGNFGNWIYRNNFRDIGTNGNGNISEYNCRDGAMGHELEW